MNELVIDVSHCDAGIDMARWVRDRGVWGVIVKAGGYEVIDKAKGYPEHFENSWYKRHGDNASALGVHLGAYYYTVATDGATARMNADHFASLLERYGYRYDLPVYADIEDPGQLGIGRRRLTDVIVEFVERVNEHGYTCGVYTGRCALTENMIGEELEKYPLWIAEYSDRCRTTINHGMWQFGGMRVDGDVFWGDRSGYVDVSHCYIDYPAIIAGNGGGGLPVVVRLSFAMAGAEVMDHFVDHDAHGYSQPNRDGVGYESLELSDRTVVEFNGGDRDCSRLVQTCLVVVGALPRGLHVWTGNERETLLANGFVEVSLDALERGDILWREGHTEMYMGDGIEAGARRSETHGIDGRTGDQDGGEIARSRFVRSHWTHAYRCVKKRPGEGTAPAPDGQGDQEEDRIMRPCFVTFDDDPTEHLFDGYGFHAAANPDEKAAAIRFWKALGVTIDPKPVKFGSADAPWGARLIDLYSRGPAFKDMEKFSRHPTNDTRFKALGQKVDEVPERTAALLEGMVGTVGR